MGTAAIRIRIRRPAKRRFERIETPALGSSIFGRPAFVSFFKSYYAAHNWLAPSTRRICPLTKPASGETKN